MSEGRTEHFNGSWRGSVELWNIRRHADSSRNGSDLHSVLWSCKEQQNTSFYSVFSLHWKYKSQWTSLYLHKCFSEASVWFNRDFDFLLLFQISLWRQCPLSFQRFQLWTQTFLISVLSKPSKSKWYEL